MIEKVEDLVHRLEMECESTAPVRIEIDKDELTAALAFMKANNVPKVTLKASHTSEFPIPGNYAATVVAKFEDEWGK